MNDIHRSTTDEELTEEELIELVLAEQQKALAQEQEEPVQGKSLKTKANCQMDCLEYGICINFEYLCSYLSNLLPSSS